VSVSDSDACPKCGSTELVSLITDGVIDLEEALKDDDYECPFGERMCCTKCDWTSRD